MHPTPVRSRCDYRVSLPTHLSGLPTATDPAETVRQLVLSEIDPTQGVCLVAATHLVLARLSVAEGCARYDRLPRHEEAIELHAVAEVVGVEPE